MVAEAKDFKEKNGTLTQEIAEVGFAKLKLRSTT